MNDDDQQPLTLAEAAILGMAYRSPITDAHQPPMVSPDPAKMVIVARLAERGLLARQILPGSNSVAWRLTRSGMLLVSALIDTAAAQEVLA